MILRSGEGLEMILSTLILMVHQRSGGKIKSIVEKGCLFICII